MIFAYSIFPRYNVQLLTSKRLSHNTYDLKKSSTAINTNLRGGEWKTSRFDRTIDGRSNALHQLPLKKQRVYSRATHEQTFPLQAGVSGVITVHVSFHDSGLATRVYSSFFSSFPFSTSLSLSRMDAQGLEAENTKGWLRVHRISEFAVYLAADAAGREGRGTRRKGGFVHRVRGGGRRVGSKDEGKKREKTVRSW